MFTDGTTTYSCDTLVAGLILQSTPVDWWCLYWIHGDMDPSIYTVMVPDVFQEQPGDSGRIQGGDCGYGVNLFRQAIHHHEGSIVPPGVQEFSDHVYRDHLPVSVRDLVGDQLPHLLCQEGLCLVACITSCDELCDVPRQPWPPVVL